jgi:hypothetical protein
MHRTVSSRGVALGTHPRRRFNLNKAIGAFPYRPKTISKLRLVVNNDLLTSGVIFFVAFLVATVTAWKIASAPRRREGHRSDPLQNGSTDGEHITD